MPMSRWLLWWPPTESSMSIISSCYIVTYMHSGWHCLYSVGNKVTTTTGSMCTHILVVWHYEQSTLTLVLRYKNVTFFVCLFVCFLLVCVSVLFVCWVVLLLLLLLLLLLSVDIYLNNLQFTTIIPLSQKAPTTFEHIKWVSKWLSQIFVVTVQPVRYSSKRKHKLFMPE